MHSKESSDHKIRVGITHGDFNGISYEIILKTLADSRVAEMITPVVYGSSKIASYFRKMLNINDINLNHIRKAEQADPKKINIVNIYDQEIRIEIGKPSDVGGELAFLALEAASADLQRGFIDVLVTAPIHKSSVRSYRSDFLGHTEYLAGKAGNPDHIMLMVCPSVRVGIVTGHVPLREVPVLVTHDLILRKLRVLNRSLKQDFTIQKPKIAVLGLNPHAGEEGMIGIEEKETLLPALETASAEDILALGPYPADGLFGSGQFSRFDAVLAMYHDQGLVPFKTLAFDEGVNYTAGLPFVRTSPAHGTAFGIAGRNEASPDSFRHAIFLGMDILRNRTMNQELLHQGIRQEHQEGPDADQPTPPADSNG
ncbi:MAG: 4-hydroxythreonine-4-phosphate dehydrogenase PdxA [Bacteroidales bacterium]|nr:4-hydroxythreonine-4-phosphate dehydrogenase PdxA [Bacteroidales bacterium]